MKRIASTAALLSFLSWTVHAEPVFMPQAASVLKHNQLEAGINGMFGYQSSSLLGFPDTTSIDRVWHVPVYGRYGVLDNLETHLLIPVTIAVDSQEGTTSSRHSETGLGNVQVGAKWNFVSAPMPLAAALDVDLPTAN